MGECLRANASCLRNTAYAPFVLSRKNRHLNTDQVVLFQYLPSPIPVKHEPYPMLPKTPQSHLNAVVIFLVCLYVLSVSLCPSALLNPYQVECHST
ncbi:hypothetical protein MED222_05155 [Vibrio sp. MED222]|nr:hypothetical protein MED222_05155 [Vibrio sp. MED222]